MKNFDNLNQNEGSSGNQWELSPEELAEIDARRKRVIETNRRHRDLREHAKDIENSDEYARAVRKHDAKSYRIHEKINEFKASEERLKDYYDRHNPDLQKNYEEEKKEHLKNIELLNQSYEFGKRWYNVAIAKNMYKKDLMLYNERGSVKKIFDWVKNGFSSERVKDSYLKKSIEFMKENNIGVEDEDFINAYFPSSHKEDDFNEAINTYRESLAKNEEMNGPDGSWQKLYNSAMDRNDRIMKADKHRAMMNGHNDNNSQERFTFSNLDSTAIAKSIRRNEKKKQKQK